MSNAHEARSIDITKRGRLKEAPRGKSKIQNRRSLETDSLNRFWPLSRHGHLVADPALGRVARDIPAAQWVDPCRFRRAFFNRPVLTLAGMLDEPGLLETLKR